MSPQVALFCTLLLLSCPAAALAAAPPADLPEPSGVGDLSLEQLMDVPVFGASRFEQKVSEAPSSVSIVTAEEIRKYGYRNLADLLGAQRGFQVTYDRMYSYLGVRGFGRTGDYNSRILLLVNGHRTNENMYDSALLGNESIVEMDLVDRVEIIRGPASSLYGDNAFFGIVNVITKRGRDLDALEVSAEAGSYQIYQGRLSWGKRFAGGFEALLSAAALRSEGHDDLYYSEFDDPSTNHGHAEDLDEEKADRLFLRASYRDLSLEAAWVDREKEDPTASFGAFFDARPNNAEDRRGYVDLRYEPRLGALGDLTARLFYDYYSYSSRAPYDVAEEGEPPALVENKDSAENHWVGAEAQLLKAFENGVSLIVGGEYQKNLRQEFENHDSGPYVQYIDLDKRTEKWALFGQAEAALLRNLRVNAGVRFDYFQTFGGTTNPRAALIYTPLKGTVFKALYGQAFRAPNMYELYYDVPAYDMKGNPDLAPEKIRTWELAWEQALGEHARLTAVGSWSKIRDLIAETVDPADDQLVFANTEEAEAKCVEVELETRGSRGFQARASYTWQQAVDAETSQPLANSPRHLVKANVAVPLWRERFLLGLEEQYQSRRRTLAPGGHGGTVFLMNLTLFSRGLLQGLELSASVYNLFDRSYGDPGGDEHVQEEIERDGRTFRVKATYAF